LLGCLFGNSLLSGGASYGAKRAFAKLSVSGDYCYAGIGRHHIFLGECGNQAWVRPALCGAGLMVCFYDFRVYILYALSLRMRELERRK